MLDTRKHNRNLLLSFWGKIMSEYHGRDGLKKLVYDERKAFVDDMWQKYKETTDKHGKAGDYRLLAEVCEKLPFFENSEIGLEIARILILNNPKKAQDYAKVQREQRDRKQILKLWDDFKKQDTSEHYDNVNFRRTIAEILGRKWNEDNVRQVIRDRDNSMGKTD